jgi:hypothetical protein
MASDPNYKSAQSVRAHACRPVNGGGAHLSAYRGTQPRKSPASKVRSAGMGKRLGAQAPELLRLCPSPQTRLHYQATGEAIHEDQANVLNTDSDRRGKASHEMGG